MFVIDCREELLQWYSRQGYMPRADSPRCPFLSMQASARRALMWARYILIQFIRLAVTCAVLHELEEWE